MKSLRRPILVSIAVLTAGFVACGGDGGLEAASEELRAMQQEVDQARARVEAREVEARAAEDALKAARAALDEAEKRLATARDQVEKRANDAVLFRAVQQRLLDDAKLQRVAISARVHKRVVTLEGSVPEEELKLRAERIAADTSGVESVVNQITLRAPAP